MVQNSAASSPHLANHSESSPTRPTVDPNGQLILFTFHGSSSGRRKARLCRKLHNSSQNRNQSAIPSAASVDEGIQRSADAADRLAHGDVIIMGADNRWH